MRSYLLIKKQMQMQVNYFLYSKNEKGQLDFVEFEIREV